MSDRTALGDRMKLYEQATRTMLPRRTYSIIRVDGKSFHSYLRDAVRPFDGEFAADMDATAEALCSEISGSVFAYTQSDEISVLVTDFGSLGTQPWFGGVTAKQISIAAAIATATLNSRRAGRALFDARVFSLPNAVEVANYLIWRQRDAVRNSVSMAAQTYFSPTRLHKVSTGLMQEMLFTEKGVNWNNYPDGLKRGRITVKQTGERPVVYVDKRTNVTHETTAIRSWWLTMAAPNFTAQPDHWLADIIPPMPTLTAPVGVEPPFE